jgi:hypothetical protein
LSEAGRLFGGVLLGVVAAGCAAAPVAPTPVPMVDAASIGLDPDRLSPEQLAALARAMARLDPLIEQHKRDGTANVLTWEALYAPLEPPERAFLDAFRSLKAESLGATSHFFGVVEGLDLAAIGTQQTVKDSVATSLPPQYLPRRTLEAYRKMMAAMQQDLGRQLLVESGYRSPAYQLYLFLHYLPNHAHSIRETNRHVALPGYSEHGAPQRQAIDFINAEGINGEERPEAFEALPEYAWLQANAARFGFHLSYPRDNPHNTAFEPWHWHVEAAE